MKPGLPGQGPVPGKMQDSTGHDQAAALQAIEAGQIDAVIDPATGNALLLHAAQEALRESEAKFRDLIEQASDGIFLGDGTYARCSVMPNMNCSASAAR